MNLLKTHTDRPSALNLIPLLVVFFLLGACQMPSPTSSSGQSGSSGSSAPSGGGMPSPPSGGSSSPSGSSAPPSEPPSSGEQGSGSQGGSKEGQESAGGSAGDEQRDSSSGQGDSVEGLDAQLDASLEGFDDSMGSSSSQGPDEIDILSPSGSSGVAADSDEPLFEEAGSGIPGESNAEIEQAAQEGPEGSEGQAGSPGEPGASSPEGEGSNSGRQQQADTEVIPIPDDIDDGQGDDIVLRQIRDAAMREKDPVLRERLWDEYRRIKNQ